MQTPSTKEMKTVGSRFLASFQKHDVMTLAAALAFYTALSLAPLVLLVITVVGFLGGNAQADFLTQIRSVLGEQAGGAIEMIVQNANQHPRAGGIAGVIGVLTLIFSASAVFGQMQSSINVIWEAQAKSKEAGWVTYLRKRFLSMGMVLALAFLAMVSLLVSTALGSLATAESALFSVLNVVISVLVFTLVFGMIFKYLPDVKIGWRHSLAGGLFTAVLFSIGRSVIGIYLSKSAVGSAYGAAGSLIVFLAWVYYSSVIIFVGAELTKAVFSKDFASPKQAVRAAKAAPVFA